MSSVVALRVFLAPVVVIAATSIVPPTDAIVSPVSAWLNVNVPPTLAAISSLSNSFASKLSLHTTTTDSASAALPATELASLGADELGRKNIIAVSLPQIVADPVRPSRIISPAPLPKAKPAIVTAPMQSPAPEPVLASLTAPAAPVEAAEPAAAPLAPEAKKIVDLGASSSHDAAPQTKRGKAEKKVFASLGTPATESAAVAPPPAALEALPPAPIAALTPPKPPAAESRQIEASLGTSTTDVAAGPPPEQAFPQARQLPSEIDRAKEFPDANKGLLERHASLGPSGSRSGMTDPQFESSYVPPEKMRVAYDAPVVTERPKSIGKRQYVNQDHYSGLGSPDALLEALRHMGARAKELGVPASLWCADFMNLVLRHAGLDTTGSRAARSFLKYGQRITEPRVGAIAIFSRGRNGGHVGIVRGTDGNGNPIIVSGNHNNKVAEAVYPKSRVLAYVVPPENAR